MTNAAGPATVRVRVPSLDPDFDAVWSTLLDLAVVPGAVWSLVGGQMVLLHAIEHDRMPPVISTDGDALADVRAKQASLRLLSEWLVANGFTAIRAPGVRGQRTHRFEREGELGPVVIDLLAPEGLGQKADLTTIHPGRTIAVPGGSQALTRTEFVDVEHNGRVATLGRPNLLGAIIAKAAACALPRGNGDRHYRDLAFLLTLVDDVAPMADELAALRPTASDRRRLAGAADLLAPAHRWAWDLIPDDVERSYGRSVFERLLLPSR